MTPEQVRAVYAASVTAGRAELVLALGAALRENERLESAMLEDRRQRGVGW